jgi:hypothetical protein
MQCAEQSLATGPEEAFRPPPWRRIVDHLSVLGRDELLQVDPGAKRTGRGIAVRRTVSNGRSGAKPYAENGSRKTTCTLDVRAESWAKARFARRIERAVRNGEYRRVTCLRRGSKIFAVMTGGSPPAAPSNGAWRPPLRVRRGASARRLSRIAPSGRKAPPSGRRATGNKYEKYQLAVAVLLLCAAALMSAMTARNENPSPQMFSDAIVGQVLIDGRGADGVTVSLDGGAPTETRTGGLFRFEGVAAGTHTVRISNYPVDASFGRTAATAIVADNGNGPATVNFFGSYLRASPGNGTATPRRGGAARTG